MARYNTECIVLKSINYKDTDKIFTLYSKNLGKISATAKGVRKVSSRRGGHLDTLNHTFVGISEGSSGFKYISEVDCRNSFNKLKLSLTRSTNGYYIAELVYRLLEEDQPNPQLFELLLKTLKLLDALSTDEHFVITFFEVTLMKNLGYALTLDKCISCNNTFSTSWEHFGLNFSLGGLLCGNCSSKGIPITQDTALGFNSLDKGVLNKNVEDFKKVSVLLKHYIKEILGSDFKTFRVFGDFSG